MTRPLTLLTLFCGLLLSARVGATVLLPPDFTRMVTESQVIVHARVVAVRGELVGSRRTIESRVTVAVVSTLKGGAVQEIVFRVPGGQVGRYRRVFIGAPVLKTGDEVVLFLKGRGPAIAMPYGLSQGVYRVSRAAGRAMVVPGAAMPGATGVPRGASTRGPLTLDEFARQVRLTGGAR